MYLLYNENVGKSQGTWFCVRPLRGKEVSMFLEETYECANWNGGCKGCSFQEKCEFKKNPSQVRSTPSNKKGETLEQLMLENK